MWVVKPSNSFFSTTAGQVAEQKYEAIKSINMALESTILQLRHQVEIGRSRQSRRRQIVHQQSGGLQGAAGAAAAGGSVLTSPAGLSASPGSPPSFSSASGASTEQLSVSLAVEASEGLNELYWQGIDTNPSGSGTSGTLNSAQQENRP